MGVNGPKTGAREKGVGIMHISYSIHLKPSIHQPDVARCRPTVASPVSGPVGPVLLLGHTAKTTHNGQLAT